MRRSSPAPGSGLPLLLAAAHLIDVFDGRNVIAAWIPYAILLAVGIGAARAGRLGPALGGALCAIGIGVIVATNLLPGYQRDDWRGSPTRCRFAPASRGRSSANTTAARPCRSIWGAAGRQHRDRRAREIAFAALRIRHT